MIGYKGIVLAFALLAQAASNSGCYTATVATPENTASRNLLGDVQLHNAEKSARSYNSIHISENGEMENIKRYVEETTQPGMIGYITLFTLGRPIAYYAVKGPVTDCARELTPMQHPAASILDPGASVSNVSYEYMADSPNDEGTYGGLSHPCVFFYDENGVLVRWSGEYLYSDRAIRLSEKPLVINVVEGK